MAILAALNLFNFFLQINHFHNFIHIKYNLAIKIASTHKKGRSGWERPFYCTASRRRRATLFSC